MRKNRVPTEQPPPKSTSRRPPASAELNRNFGDMVYDLFYSLLWNHKGARTLYLGLWRELDREIGIRGEEYRKYARAWVLQRAVHLVRNQHAKWGRVLSPAEQVMLDANLTVPARLRQFDSYLHKLPLSDQILLLLRDKYALPYSEVAAVLETPEGALRVQHQQALRTLEEWLWDQI